MLNMMSTTIIIAHAILSAVNSQNNNNNNNNNNNANTNMIVVKVMNMNMHMVGRSQDLSKTTIMRVSTCTWVT